MPVQLEMDRAVVSEGVVSRSSSRFLWMVFSFATLMLIGVAACIILPLAPHASANSTNHVPALAFLRSMRVPSPTSNKDIDNKDDIHIRDIRIIRAPKDIRGQMQRLSPVMSGVLDRPETGSSQSAVLDRPGPTLQLQYAPPPTPPPPSPPTPPPGGGGGNSGDGGAILKQLSDSEAVTILDAWISRLKVYCLSSQFDDPEGLAPGYRAALQRLESFRSFVVSSPNRTQSTESNPAEEKYLCGVYKIADLEDLGKGPWDDRALTIAGGLHSGPAGLSFPAGTMLGILGDTQDTPEMGGLSTGGTLHIKHVAVNPKNIRDPNFGLSALKHILRAAARFLSLTLLIEW